MPGAGHVLDLWLLTDEGIPDRLWRRAKEPFTTVVVWSLGDDPAGAAAWTTRGAGAVIDAELVAGLIHRGFVATERRSATATSLERLAREGGRDVRVVDLGGTIKDLRSRLPQLEQLLFSQERSGVVIVCGKGSSRAKARRVLQGYCALRGASWTTAAAGEHARWPADAGLCKNLLWRRKREEIIVLHRCTHERFGLRLAPSIRPIALLGEARELLGLDHPLGAKFVDQRLKETLARARHTVPVFRSARSFHALPVATPAAWAAQFWETTSIPAHQRTFENRPDLQVRSSSGTSLGTPRAQVVEQAVWDDRHAAEISMWERVSPWRVAIVNRPTNLFSVDALYNRYRSRRKTRDLRATPGANPTEVPARRWKLLAGAIEAYDPTAIGGDAQYLVGLSRHLSKSHLPALREVILSNHTSWSFQRRDLGRHFGLDPTALYHAGETSMIGRSCRHGRWHLLETYAHYEVFARGKPAALGERGLLVVTVFDSHVRPLLRYALGDIVRLDEQECPCGRPGRTVLLDGRAAFTFRDGHGRWVTPRQVDTALQSTSGVQHLAVRREPSSVILRYIGAPDAEIPAAHLAEILALPVTLERVDSLPLAAPGGKLELFSGQAGHSLQEAHFLDANAPAIDYSTAAS